MRKEPTKEMKIGKIITMIEDMEDTLEEEYIDDLVSVVQQYHALAMATKQQRENATRKKPEK